MAAQETVPTGMVDQPCNGLTVAVPDTVKTYIQALMTQPQSKTLPPAPTELGVYREANAEARKKDWPDLCRYRADNDRLRRGPASQRRIVFMGDSITQSWAIADPNLFSDGIVNRGISGQTTPQMLVRFQADVVALQPAAVHIMAGTNDVAGNSGPNSIEDYQNNIKAMVTLAKAAGIRVILGAIPPTSGFTWKPEVEPAPRIAELNAWLRQFAKTEKLAFIDYHTALAAPGGALRPELTYDGVHPNDAGYDAMASLVRPALIDVEQHRR